MTIKQNNRQRILEALSSGAKTQAQLTEDLSLSVATVWRWLERLMADDEVHIRKYISNKHGGPYPALYRKGPKPDWLRPTKPVANTNKRATDAYRRRLKASGEWEDMLARQRGYYWKKKMEKGIKRDPLTAAFFGNTME